ncbi:phosphoethanolamine transferase [Morganella morganii]|uniref:phosphoethanolamine transferase n=1 Tax=Morganella morganii TaxID=582 RepID=UPI001C7D282E|nr:phosphoethanolamine transferase [Morganella morganii]
MKKYKYPVIMIALIIMSYLVNTFIYKRDSTAPHLATLALFLCTFILLNNTKWYSVITGFIITLIFSLEVAYFAEFHEKISTGVIDSGMETNSSEASAMLGHYIFSILLPAIAVSLLITIFFRKKTLVLPRWFKISPLIVCVFLLISLVREAIADHRILMLSFREDPYEPGRYLRDKFPVVAGNLLYIAGAAVSNDRYAEEYTDRKLNNAVIAGNKPENKVIVFVIGESSSPSRYHIYGYPGETTPEMERIFTGSGSCATEKVHSSAPITRNSISLSLSFYTPESEENLFREKSIIEMAQDQGYKTYWLGAQPVFGVHGSKYGFIANKSDVITVDEDNDMALPGLLKKALSEPEEYKFIIVHLLGSHKPYANYTETEKSQFSDDYDRTIRYTDRVMGHLYDEITAAADDYTLIYTSDHGELIGKGHGFTTGSEQFMIPFLYKSANSSFDCQFIEKYRNQDGWLSGLMNKYILSELLGYLLNQKVVESEKNNDRILSAEDYSVPFHFYLEEN